MFNVAAFRNLEVFKQEVTEFAHYLKATPPAEGFTEVLYPGEIEYRREQDRRKNGIAIEDATWNELQESGARIWASPTSWDCEGAREEPRDMSFRGQSPAPAGGRALPDRRARRFIEDIDVPGQAWMHVVRSPHAHAVIERIDTTAAQAHARRARRVHRRRLAELGPLPCTVPVASVAPMIVPPRLALASDRVRHVGDPVAFVVAETRVAARDAAEAVVRGLSRLAVRGRCAGGVTDGAPQVWDQAPGNLSYRFQKGDADAVQARCATAAHVVELELVNNRIVISRAGNARRDRALR